MSKPSQTGGLRALLEQARFFGRFFTALPWRLTVLIVGAILQGVLVIPITLTIQWIIDTAIPESQFHALLYAGGLLFVLRLAGNSIGLAARSSATRMVADAIAGIRTHLNDHLLFDYSRDTYTHIDASHLHTVLVQDTSRLDRLFHELLARVLPSLTIGAILGSVLIYLNGALFLILCLFIPVMLLCTRWAGRKVRGRVRMFQDVFEMYSKRTLFNLQNLDLIRIHAQGKKESSQSENVIRALSSDYYRMSMAYALHGFLQTNLLNVYAMAFLIAGGFLVALEQMTFGTFLSFFVVANLLNGYVGRLLDALPDLIAGHESIRKLHAFIDRHSPQPYSGTDVIPFSGTIRFRDVTFGYEPDRPPVLDKLACVLRPGCITGITGDNGVGKTTLANLLLGFYKPQTGSVSANGIPYEQLDVRALRKSMGVVTQDPVFFQGTIRENMTYGREDISDQELREISALALAAPFIESLPDGYDTEIGEGGVLLSGGQRQRLAITRALCTVPRLLVLDEVTNHLDEASMDLLVKHLKSISPKPAILMISHEPKVLDCCDEIFTLRHGQLHAQSRHSVPGPQGLLAR